jgi:cysteine synthase B
VDQTESVSQADAENMARKLAVTEGCSAASRRRLRGRCGIAPAGERHIVFIVCDRGDRYLSTGVFPPDAGGA